jgi:poly-gamma-glutamate synthesis protein (capsule biosynthesis protein)
VRRHLSLRRAAALLGALALAGCNGWQHPAVRPTPQQGTLVVEVLDANGAAVANVPLTLGGQQAVTDATGAAAFAGLPEGGYLLTAEGSGWAPDTWGVRALFPTTAPEQRLQVQLAPADLSDVRLLFAGDLSFEDGIGDPNRDGIAGDSLVPRGPGAAAGATALLAPMAPLLARFDLVTANLATVLGDGATPHPLKPTRALAPPEVALGLAATRVDVVCLGNDHAYDYLDEGVSQTLAALTGAEVEHFGSGRDIAEASTPSLVSRLGFTIGQVALSAILGHGATPQADTPPFSEAEQQKGGVVPATPETVRAAVAQAALGSDLVVAHLTAGSEWGTDTTDLAPLAQAAAEGGAALIVGHGPRPLQPLLDSGGVVAAGGLGQLVFGGQRPEGRVGVMLEALVRYRRLHALRLWPVALVHYTPQLAVGQLASRIVRRLGTLSQPGVLVYPWQGRGQVVLASRAVRTPEDSRQARATLDASPDGDGATAPVPLVGWEAGDGDAFVISVDATVASGPARALSLELGRELLWDGGFEDQTAGGAGIGLGAGWRYAAPDVGPSDAAVHGGRLALELVRKSGNAGPASARSAGLHRLSAGQRYTFTGCWQTVGEVRGHAALVVYPSRDVNATPVMRVAAADLTPTPEWQCFRSEYQPLEPTLVATEVVLERPEHETARLFVDDLSLIEWDAPLQTAASQVTAPNEYEYLRCRAPEPGGEVALRWVIRRYLPR